MRMTLHTICTMTTDFGAMVKAVRLEREWTIKQAADVGRVSEATLSRIETGSSDPSLTTVRKLVKAFALDPVEVLR